MSENRQKELLARWRDLQRQFDAADARSRDALATEVLRVRREYFAEVEAVWLAVREMNHGPAPSHDIETHDLDDVAAPREPTESEERDPGGV